MRRLALVLVLCLALLPTGAAAAVPTSAVAGGTLPLEFSVKNTGKKKARAGATVVILSRDGKRSADDVVLAKVRTPALKRSRSAKLSPKVTVPAGLAPGAYQLLACPSFTKSCRVLAKSLAVRAPVGGSTVPVGGPAPSPALAGPPIVVPPTPQPPAPPAPTTPVPTTPAPTTPVPTTPGPKTGLEITPATITLGSLAPSATTEEWVAATRLVSVTNHGPQAQPVSLYFEGYQSGTITSTQVATAPDEVGGQAACFEGRNLAVGSTCWARLYWHPGSQAGVPLAGDLKGTFGVRIPNTATALVSTSVTAGLTQRAFITAATTVFQASSGYKYRNRLVVRNDGELAGGFSITKRGDDPGGYFYEDPTRPGQNTCDGNLAPGESCEIPYAFCASTALGDDERYRATLAVEGSSVTTITELVASNRQSDPPKLCGGIFDEE